MKNYKKVIALLMTASMTVGLAACGGNSNDTQKESGKTPSSQGNNGGGDTSNPGGENSQKVDPYTVQIDPSTGKAYDLGNMEIIVRDWWEHTEKSDDELSGYEKAQKEYRDWAQETYNFTVKEQQMGDWGSVFNDFVEYVSTGGDDQNYVFTLRFAGELFQEMAQDLMYDVSSATSIDMSDEGWDQNVKDAMTLKGKVFGMRRWAHENRTGVYFNKRLLTEAGIDPNEIYELQRTHQWTWDKFEEYLKILTKDTDGDGAMDQYGLLEANSLRDIMVASNGGNLVGQDPTTKKYTFEVDKPETIKALDTAQDWIEKYNKPTPEGANWDWFFSDFINGGTAFCVQQAYCAGQNFKGMEDDFGFVAFPMGPSKTNYVDLNQDNVYAIPGCYEPDRANKIAFAYSMYYHPVPEYEDYSIYTPGYIENFRDTEAPEETMGYMKEEIVNQMHSFVPGISVGNDLYWQINKENTAAAQAESIRESWQAYIDAANEGIVEKK